jgi:hypothetical protein
MRVLSFSQEEVQMPRIGDDEMKRLVKDALKEWLDEKFLMFGKWSVTAVSATALAALLYFMLKMNGWNR